MTNVRTLRDINKGHRLGSMYEEELENKLYTALKSKTEVNDLSEKLQNKYSKQVKDFNWERKGWNRERKQWESAFSNVTSDKQKLHTYALELIGETKQLKIENTNLTSENIRKDLSLAKSKAENATKSKKIKSLKSMIKILEGKLSSAQKDVILIQSDSSKKETEIASLKSKIAELENIKSELESKVNELEYLKLEAISKPIVGGDDEGQSLIVPTIKNMQSEEQSSITKSEDISTVLQNRPLGDSSNHDTYVKTNNNALQEIPNMTPYLAQLENNMSSLIELNSQMAHSAESLIPPIGTIPIVATNNSALRASSSEIEIERQATCIS
ncbi:6683_t:CDS:2 [Entrophospora sp. SA101]|nr:6683_t:CDS:2 [Entrophospora sp. SA101]